MRVFLSSTCYDLVDVRAVLAQWLEENHHTVLASDRPDYPGPPDLHRHDACIWCVDYCDLFIAVIDSRYGAPFHTKPEISVTWAEIRRAFELNKTKLIFIRSSVFNERETWKLNRENESFKAAFVDNLKTFDIISEIQGHPSGAWIEIFVDVTDITAKLNAVFSGRNRGAISRTGQTINLGDLSDPARRFIQSELNLPQNLSSVPVSGIRGVFDSIPASPTLQMRSSAEIEPGFTPVGYFDRIRRADDEGDLWQVTYSPTASGLAIRNELAALINED